MRLDHNLNVTERAKICWAYKINKNGMLPRLRVHEHIVYYSMFLVYFISFKTLKETQIERGSFHRMIFVYLIL